MEMKGHNEIPILFNFTEIRLRLIKNGKFVYPHKGKPTKKMLKKMQDTLIHFMGNENLAFFIGGHIQGRFLKEDGKMSCWLPACTEVPISDIIASLRYLHKKKKSKGRDTA